MEEKQKEGNKFLLEEQLKILKLFLERNLITQDLYNYEVKILTSKMKEDE